MPARLIAGAPALMVPVAGDIMVASRETSFAIGGFSHPNSPGSAPDSSVVMAAWRSAP
jgi:hypothetical protein